MTVVGRTSDVNDLLEGGGGGEAKEREEGVFCS